MMTAGLVSFGAQAADPIKIAYIDPLSGGMANVGDAGAKHFEYMADVINARGGVLGGRKFEIVAMDGKLNPQASVIEVQKAIDQGIRIITQGNGSSVASAISEFVRKYNDRNPGKEVLYLNYAAVDPVLTNEKCNFWHFRFDANADMKMQAITNYLKGQPQIKKVYLIDQDYSFGHAVAGAAVKMIKEKRPDIQIVANEFHPLAKVTDFSPYVAKIKASGADAVITGNWGNDLSLLIKSAADAGLKAQWFTYYGGGLGTPTAIGEAGKDRVVQITEWHNNLDAPAVDKLRLGFEKKNPNIDFYYYRVAEEMEMLAKAIDEAKSADPKKIAFKLEGMHFKSPMGDTVMRASDHQFFQPLYMSILSGGMKHDVEKTGLGFKTLGKIDTKDTVTPTTCKMERPAA